jgi:hypothetical protein
VSEETTNRYFDELATGLASGSLSRRKALRLMGAALVGGALASFPGVALAAVPNCGGRPCPPLKVCRRGGGRPRCECPAVTCIGGTVNQTTCLCECPGNLRPVGGHCVCLERPCAPGQEFDFILCGCVRI